MADHLAAVPVMPEQVRQQQVLRAGLAAQEPEPQEPELANKACLPKWAQEIRAVLLPQLLPLPPRLLLPVRRPPNR